MIAFFPFKLLVRGIKSAREICWKIWYVVSICYTSFIHHNKKCLNYFKMLEMQHNLSDFIVLFAVKFIRTTTPFLSMYNLRFQASF